MIIELWKDDNGKPGKLLLSVKIKGPGSGEARGSEGVWVSWQGMPEDYTCAY